MNNIQARNLEPVDRTHSSIDFFGFDFDFSLLQPLSTNKKLPLIRIHLKDSIFLFSNPSKIRSLSISDSGFCQFWGKKKKQNKREGLWPTREKRERSQFQNSLSKSFEQALMANHQGLAALQPLFLSLPPVPTETSRKFR